MDLKEKFRPFVICASIIVWFSLALQFSVSLNLSAGNYLETTKIFLSYFTVTTNIIVAFCFSCLSFLKWNETENLFAKSSTLTAITVYIVVVGLIYNIMLRGIVSPVGWARAADELLHVVNPLIFLLFWIFFVKKSTLQYKQALSWLIYPLLYVIFIVIRGYLINKYPYPFIDVVQLGYPKAILNAIIVIFIFWLLSLFFIFIGKKTAKV
ncbi:Pr6Pr family membrane protein [Pedobacter jeongneungensis]|uniref:Pr6Pr family membrane protein n=1 Tax=Pedobacter jeongneungensis TaxID=947309 RepID=UPI0004693AC7|nr:Pr6Pr family membrane protein [Pedobacter jeongneungensis]